MQLVERRPPTKGERFREPRSREDLDEGAADHEVLLDLDILNPRRMGTPCGDEVARDHVSTSISAFTSSFHFADRDARCADSDGTSAMTSPALFRTKAARASVLSSCPTRSST